MFKKKPKGGEAPTESETPAAAGADGETLAIEGDGPKKKGLPLKMLIIAGAAGVLVLGGGGTGAFMLLGHQSSDKAGEHRPKPKKPKKGGEGEGGKVDRNAAVIADGPDGVVFYTLPDLVVNMQTADGKPTFLKLKLTFELPDAALVPQVQGAMPRVMDAFQTYLRELRPTDLDGSAGLYRLKEELTRRVNHAIAPAKIRAVLFREVVVQ